MKKEKEETIVQSQLLEIGWTKSMIQKLLPEPELRRNPVYRSASPMKVWKKSVVEDVMQTEEFARLCEKAKRRSKSALKAVEKKRENLMKDTMQKLQTMSVKILPEDELIERTLEEKQEWYAFHDDFEIIRVETIAVEVLERWIVNFIRHNLVEYDESLYELRGRVGKSETYIAFKIGILSKIAEAYPQHADECERQIKEVG